MAQEVQTTLDYKAELNLIEGVGHQENRVKEHTQVEQAFGYECALSASKSIPATGGQTMEDVKVTLNLNSMSGPTEFKIVDGGLRIPLSGAYLAHIEVYGGSGSFTLTHYLRVDGKNLVQQATNSISHVVIEKVLNLGRYNLLEYWANGYYSGSGGSSAATYINMTLKKL